MSVDFKKICLVLAVCCGASCSATYYGDMPIGMTPRFKHVKKSQKKVERKRRKKRIAAIVGALGGIGIVTAAVLLMKRRQAKNERERTEAAGTFQKPNDAAAGQPRATPCPPPLHPSRGTGPAATATYPSWTQNGQTPLLHGHPELVYQLGSGGGGPTAPPRIWRPRLGLLG